MTAFLCGGNMTSHIGSRAFLNWKSTKFSPLDNSKFDFVFPSSKIFLLLPPPAGGEGGNTQRNWDLDKMGAPSSDQVVRWRRSFFLIDKDRLYKAKIRRYDTSFSYNFENLFANLL